MSQPVKLTTKLSAQDIAQLFRLSMRVSWWSEHITGAGTTFEKPPGSAFDDIDSDPPKFSVRAMIGGRGFDIQKSAVDMYIWDRGTHREVLLDIRKSLGSFGIKANGKIQKFIAAIKATERVEQTHHQG